MTASNQRVREIDEMSLATADVTRRTYLQNSHGKENLTQSAPSQLLIAWEALLEPSYRVIVQTTDIDPLFTILNESK